MTPAAAFAAAMSRGCVFAPAIISTGTRIDEKRTRGMRKSVMNRATPDPAVADKFLQAIGDSGNNPAFVHCGSGNRAAAMWMIKRMVVDGWDVERAGTEAAALGLTNENLKKFAVDYAAKKKG